MLNEVNESFDSNFEILEEARFMKSPWLIAFSSGMRLCLLTLIFLVLLILMLNYIVLRYVPVLRSLRLDSGKRLH